MGKLAGYACCMIAGFFFGTNYIPVKSVDCGDGVFFSLAMSTGILMVGFLVGVSPLVDAEWGFSPVLNFNPLAAVGGSLWMLGNLLVPTIVRRVGLGLGLTIWDISNMVKGWATGFFGLFGIWQAQISNPLMNVIGLVMCVISLFFFVASGQADSSNQVEEPHVPDILEVCAECAGDDHNGGSDDDDDDDTSVDGTGSTSNANDVEENHEAVVVKISEISGSWRYRRSRRSFALGLVLALFAGLLFGTTFDLPTQLMQCGVECPPGDSTCTIEDLDDICMLNTMIKLLRVESDDCVTTAHRNASDHCVKKAFFVKPYSPDSLHYVISHYVGIFLMGLIVFIGYVTVSAARGRASYRPVNLILPSMASGVMWGVAQTAWFVANEELSMSVAFPIISTLPGLVALLSGVLFFGELRTPKSRQLALIGVLIRLPGVLLIALSS